MLILFSTVSYSIMQRDKWRWWWQRQKARWWW